MNAFLIWTRHKTTTTTCILFSSGNTQTFGSQDDEDQQPADLHWDSEDTLQQTVSMRDNDNISAEDLALFGGATDLSAWGTEQNRLLFLPDCFREPLPWCRIEDTTAPETLGKEMVSHERLLGGNRSRDPVLIFDDTDFICA